MQSDVTSSAARGLTGTGSRNGAPEEGLATNPDVKQIIKRQSTEVIHEGNEFAGAGNYETGGDSVSTPPPMQTRDHDPTVLVLNVDSQTQLT